MNSLVSSEEAKERSLAVAYAPNLVDICRAEGSDRSGIVIDGNVTSD